MHKKEVEAGARAAAVAAAGPAPATGEPDLVTALVTALAPVQAVQAVAVM